MIEDCRKTGENSLINDKLKTLTTNIYISFLFFVIVLL